MPGEVAETPSSDLTLPVIASLTLGLAPFAPMPHLAEKLMWLATGHTGWRAVDVLDVAMHGAPWVWLAWALWQRVRSPAEPTEP